jgi:hypothetical protein
VQGGREKKRQRLRERAAEAQLVEERGDTIGKWPRWTGQDKSSDVS